MRNPCVAVSRICDFRRATRKYDIELEYGSLFGREAGLPGNEGKI